VQYLGELHVECDVYRNDQIGLDDVAGYQGVLLSPGPGTPDRAGICMDLIGQYAGQVPIFGVCLGHQAIAEVYGATVGRAPELLHGKTSLVDHDGRGVFDGLPNPMTATRYHSLAVVPDTVPDVLEVSARTASGVIMGLRHRTLAVEGVQFHPESVLTEGGHRMLANWLTVCGDTDAVARSEGLSPVVG